MSFWWVFFPLLSTSVELRMAPVQNCIAGAAVFLDRGLEMAFCETENVRRVLTLDFFSFPFPFSPYWPCSKCSLSHRDAMWQLCRHLKSQE